MKFGAHVSIAGGIFNAPANAKKIGCEVFQIFSRSPRGGPAPPLTEDVLSHFKSAMKENGQAEAYIHTPYYINLASSNNRIRLGSIEVIRQELERASLLGLPYIMTHLGSANDCPRAQAVRQVIQGVQSILTGYKGAALLLLENSAGSGNVVGNSFEEIRQIIKGVPRQTRNKLAVCFDTCHAFASGYDLRSKKAVNQTMNQFNKIIGSIPYQITSPLLHQLTDLITRIKIDSITLLIQKEVAKKITAKVGTAILAGFILSVSPWFFIFSSAFASPSGKRVSNAPEASARRSSRAC